MCYLLAMNRQLAFDPPAPRHPFRASLPSAGRVQQRNDDQDLKLFVLSFTAFFICIYTFIF